MVEREGRGEFIWPEALLLRFEELGPQICALVESRWQGSAALLHKAQTAGFEQKNLPLGAGRSADVTWFQSPVFYRPSNWLPSGSVALHDESLKEERIGEVKYGFGREIYGEVTELQVRKETFDISGRRVGHKVIHPSDKEELGKVKKLLGDVELALQAEGSRN